MLLRGSAEVLHILIHEAVSIDDTQQTDRFIDAFSLVADPQLYYDIGIYY